MSLAPSPHDSAQTGHVPRGDESDMASESDVHRGVDEPDVGEQGSTTAEDGGAEGARRGLVEK